MFLITWIHLNHNLAEPTFEQKAKKELAMTIRHYALGFAAIVVALPVLALLFFLLPVLLPIALAMPFVIAASRREAARQEPVAAEPAFASLEPVPAGLVVPLRREVGTFE